MVRRLIAAFAVVMCACQANPAASPSPPAAASTTPVASAVTSPAADLPVTRIDLSCRLPVLVSSLAAAPAPFKGGFIQFPGGAYSADPGGVIEPPDTQGFLRTKASPVLTGLWQSGGLFYDLSAHRWLPVGSGQASPDGASYAYAVPGATSSDLTDVHIVDVAHASDLVVRLNLSTTGAANGWQVGDFDGDNVFLLGTQLESPPRGVWQYNTSRAFLQKLSDARSIFMVRGGYAWVGLVDPRDPSPPPVLRFSQPFDSLARIDLSTDTATTWIYSPGQAVDLLGVDAAGNPIVRLGSGPDFDTSHGSVRLLAAPGDPGSIISAGNLWLAGAQADGGRIWFGNDQGVYVWTAGDGLRKVYAFTGGPSQVIAPAGRCV